MAERRGLADDLDMKPSKKGGAAPASSMDKGKIIKITVAVVLLLAAAVVVVINLGLFETEPPPTPSIMETMTPEERKETERILEQKREQERITPPSGS